MLGDLHVEERDRQLHDRASATSRSDGRRPRRRSSDGAQRSHLVDRRRQSVRRPVGQPIVVIVDAGERRVHRPQAVVALEERASSAVISASGSETQRRSRNDCSTALMTSCTQAPSPKSPSLAAIVARGSRR